VAIPEPPDTSMVNTISNAYQSAIIQKENANLREMCKKLQVSYIIDDFNLLCSMTYYYMTSKTTR
jgi:hypothetical protein